jgi:hypothetical protein
MAALKFVLRRLVAPHVLQVRRGFFIAQLNHFDSANEIILTSSIAERIGISRENTLYHLSLKHLTICCDFGTSNAFM